MHIASKLKIDFNVDTLTFSDTYPEHELKDAVTEEEFKAILQKINVELAAKLHKNSESLKKWFRTTKYLCLVVVGIFLLPVVFHKSSKQTKLLTEFQDDVKDYLYKINRKKYLKRKVEWKLVKDKRRAKSKDAVNPESQIRLEIIYESSTMMGASDQYDIEEMEDWAFEFHRNTVDTKLSNTSETGESSKPRNTISSESSKEISVLNE